MDMSRMSFTPWGCRVWGSLPDKARRLFWPAMMAALLLTLGIGQQLPAWAGPVWGGLAVVTGLVVCADVCRGVRRKAKFRAGAHRTGYPLVTMGFIAAGALVYLVLPEPAADRLCGLNLEAAGLGDVVRVTVVRSLLHGSLYHLLTNAILLGILGFYLEPDLGPWRALAVLGLGSCVAGLVGLNLLLSQVDVFHGGGRWLHYPPAGGTGAAAAFMGFGAVRRYHRRPDDVATGEVSPLPGLMGVLTPLLAGLLFMGVFSGHTLPLTGPDGMAGYWGQVGGCLGGMAMAVAVGTLGDPAIFPPPTRINPRGVAPRPPRDTRDAAWSYAEFREAVRASGGSLNPAGSR